MNYLKGNLFTRITSALFRGRQFLAILILLFLAWEAYAGSCLLSEKQLGEKAVIMPVATEWQKTGTGLLGVNILYYFDDDVFWANPHAIDTIKKGHVSTLRFPGGELADNYDWENHSVERPREWPGEAATQAGREQRTDYKEFLGYARKVGVNDVFFVVNVDGAFHAPGDRNKNIAKYADKAARWVKAVKDAGYRVRYWEIGNESYLGDGPLKAEEYALVLRTFSKAMRAVDPTIIICAAGPGGVQGIGFADRLGEEGLRRLRNNGGNKQKACRGLTTAECVEKFAVDPDGSKKEKAWWPTLIKEAGGSFDLAVVHRYKYTRDEQGTFSLTRNLKNLKNYLHKSTGRVIPIALTEWNTPNEQKHKSLTEIAQLLDIAVQIGNNAAGGVDFAHYWPMRISTGNFKPFLDSKGDLTAVGRLFNLYAGLLAGAEVSESSPTKNVYVLRTRKADETGYVMVNAGSTAVRLKLNDVGGRRISISKMIGNQKGEVLSTVVCDETTLKTTVGLNLPEESISIVRVAN